MNMIYMTQAVWEEGAMERAVGDTQGVPCIKREDKVIDLAAWKAENLVELEVPESGLGSYEGRELVRRPRRKHAASLARAELAATLSVVGLMLALVVRVLVF